MIKEKTHLTENRKEKQEKDEWQKPDKRNRPYW